MRAIERQRAVTSSEAETNKPEALWIGPAAVSLLIGMTLLLLLLLLLEHWVIFSGS